MPKPHSRLRYQISSYFVSRLLCLKPKEAVVVSRQLAYYSHMPLHQSLWILHCRISKVTGTGITDCPTAHGPAKPVSSSSTAWPSPKEPFKHCWLMMALRNSSAFAHLLSATLEWYIASTFTFFQVKKGWNRTGGRTKLSPGTNSMLWSPMAAKMCVWNLWNSFWSSDHNCVVDLLNSQQREQNWIEGL